MGRDPCMVQLVKQPALDSSSSRSQSPEVEPRIRPCTQHGVCLSVLSLLLCPSLILFPPPFSKVNKSLKNMGIEKSGKTIC